MTPGEASTSGSVAAVVGYSLRESVRRRVFTVVLLLTLLFFGLYSVGVHFAFRDAEAFAIGGVDAEAFTGATMLGLAMFATLFLGAVVATFLTLGVVRGDADSGLLQPLVVRPLGRTTMLLARFGGAALIAAAYGLLVYLIAVVITGSIGGWWPDHVLGPGLGLAAGLVIVASLSMLVSVFLTSTAQGIAVLMLFGAGLTAGLIGQIGEALDSDSLNSIAETASWALPFEALYQGGLHALTSETTGFTRTAISLGPFGGPQDAGVELVIWSGLYLLAALTVAAVCFGRRDL